MVKKLIITTTENNISKTQAKKKDMSKDKSENILDAKNKNERKKQTAVKGIIKVATWNVRSIYEEGSLKNLVTVMGKYRIDILALQETKLKENSIMKCDGCVLFNSGGKNRLLGTGFLLNKKQGERVIDFKAISERICWIRLRGKYRKITIVNIHAPSEEKEIETKIDFYQQIENILTRIPKYDIKIIIGDFNAKVGREIMYKKITGGKSKHEESNENGKMLIEFAAEQKMRIMSTHFDRKDIYKSTWISPDGRTCNQIDHVLIEEKFMKLVKKVRSYRGADTNSDHIMVVSDIKQKIPEKKRGERNSVRRYNMELLKDDNIKEHLERDITENLKDKEVTKDIDNEWMQIQLAVTEAAKKWLNSPKGKNKEWFDEECRNELANRNKARLDMLRNNTEESKVLYKHKQRKVKQICRKKKREYWEIKLREIETHRVNKDIRNFYQETKRSKTKPSSTSTYCRSKEGFLIGDVPGRLSRWAEYFSELLNPEETEKGIKEQENGDKTNGTQENIESPTDQEIDEVIVNLKNNKSPGENGITGEILKWGGQTLQERIKNIIKQAWEDEKLPEVWKTALIYPVHKKGDRSECRNFRGIALLDITYKVLATIIRNRLSAYANEMIGEYQGGFRKGRSTIDQIFTIKQIQHKSYEQNLDLHMLFIDYKQAYDSIKRLQIYKAMEKLGVPSKMIKLVEMTLQGTLTKVLVEGNLTESFSVNSGLRQGDPLSTILFNLVLENILRESKIETGGIIYYTRQQIIAYADDLTIVARTKKELQKVFIKLEAKSKEYGLYINEEKTKYMVLRDEEGQMNNIRFQIENKEYKFQQVKILEYLGVTLTHNCKEDVEIDKRLMKGSKAMGSLQKIMSSKITSKKTKIRLYRTIIQPTVLYGCETWILNKSIAEKLERWERKILRKIYGGVKVSDGQWRSRTNKELTEQYGHPNITQIVRAQRARWLGHLYRMPGHRHAKKALLGGEGGNRRRGRPKKKWLEAVQEDISRLGISDWIGKTSDRKEWKKVVKKIEAMGH